MEGKNRVKSVLFVCTGNVFRSLSAEVCMKRYLQKQGITNVKVSSAGTLGSKLSLHPSVVKALNIDVKNPPEHGRKIDVEKAKTFDVVVAMGNDHKKWLAKQGIPSFLFTEIAHGRTTDIQDWNELHKWKTDQDKGAMDYIEQTARLICESMEKFVKGLEELEKKY